MLIHPYIHNYTIIMSQSYAKSCMYYRHEIVMCDKGVGKWLPYDLDGGVHECKTNSTGNKKVETKTLSLEELDARLKRVESIGIGQLK